MICPILSLALILMLEDASQRLRRRRNHIYSGEGRRRQSWGAVTGTFGSLGADSKRARSDDWELRDSSALKWRPKAGKLTGPRMQAAQVAEMARKQKMAV